MREKNRPWEHVGAGCGNNGWETLDGFETCNQSVLIDLMAIMHEIAIKHTHQLD